MDPAAVLDAHPDAIVACDQIGHVVFTNAAARTMLAWPGDSLLGRPIETIVPPRLRVMNGEPFYRWLVTSAAAGRPIRTSALRRDGVELEIDLVPSSSGRHVVCALRGIQESVAFARAPRAAPDTDASYRLVFENAPIGILHFDADGVITACNDVFVRLIGSSKRVLIGLNMQTLHNAGIVRCVKSALAGERARYEGDYTSVTGGKTTPVNVDFTPILVDGEVRGGVGIVEDITERKNAERALHRSEASFRALTEISPECVAVVRDGLIVYANPAFVRACALTSTAQMIGHTLAELVHPDDRAAIEAACDAPGAVDLDASADHRDLRFLRADGKICEAEVSVVPVHFDGAPAMVVLALDVTERKALYARLAQADRMASLGTLAAGVAHEINNPLAYLIASLELLARDLGAGRWAEVGASLENAREGAERVRVIVKNLKTFSRVDEERRVPVDVVKALEGAINLCWSEIKHRASLTRDYADVPSVSGDEARLGQVFVNLLVNAAQSIPEGRAGDMKIAVSARRRGDGRVAVEIRDSGSGIAPDVMPRIFEPFFTTKPVGEGTGLGLAICHGIVASMGGEIYVESQPGVGSLFGVLLPAAEARPDPPRVDAGEPPRDAAPRVEPPRSRLLVVDDELSLARAIQRDLADAHDVIVAGGGREAIRRLLRDDRFDLILCDVMMPDASGLEVYETIAKANPPLASRFAFMTGAVLSRDAWQRLQSLGRPRLEKPFRREQVEALLGR